MLMDSSSWFLVNRPVVDLMRDPAVTSERVSQGLLGEAGEIVERQGDWVRVRLRNDGYSGWVQAHVLVEASGAAAQAYVANADTIAIGELAQAWSGASRRIPVGKIPFGVSLPALEMRDGSAALRLPDGRVWWLAESDVMPAHERPRADAEGVARTIALVERSLGVPYLWGGRTPFGYDCSGLTQAFWAFLGVVIPRDADQQFQGGRAVEGERLPGDLVFFAVAPASGPPTRFANICHVGVWLGDDAMLHASGKARCVCVERLRRGDSPYTDWLIEHLAGVRRFAPCS